MPGTCEAYAWHMPQTANKNRHIPGHKGVICQAFLTFLVILGGRGAKCLAYAQIGRGGIPMPDQSRHIPGICLSLFHVRFPLCSFGDLCIIV